MTGQSRTAIDLVLAESLKELSQTRPIEKITIKEITDKAGVIRPTFYNHFQDKYELMEWIITTELLQPMHPLIQAGMVTEAMVLMFTNIEKEKAFYTKAVKMEGVITFHEIAMKCGRELLVEIFTERKGDKEPAHKWLTVDIVATYYAQSMCFAAEEWISSGYAIPPREMAEAYNYIISRSLFEVMEEL